jgi:signal transduction histidine kinase
MNYSGWSRARPSAEGRPGGGPGLTLGGMDGQAVLRWWFAGARDVVYALAMTALVVAGAYGEAHPGQVSDQLPPGSAAAHTPNSALVLVAVAGLVLIVRHRWPRVVLAVSAGAVVVYSLLGYENGAAALAPVVALYTLATQLSARRALAWGVLITAVLMGATAAHNPFGPTGAGFWLLPGLTAAATLGGIAVASRRAYIASIQDRAEADARRTIDEERLRIARELHDVVAHTMATINVQAGAAAHVLRDRPDAAAEALATIKSVSKDGLRELRAILDVLRQADEADPTRPTPGIGQLPGLIDRAVHAGLETTLTVHGSARRLPAAVDLAAYRIVQESLTNTIRHAGPATAAVTLTYADGEFLVEVTDTGLGGAGLDAGGLGGPDLGGGHGLIGMRERATSVGGSLQAGPRPDGGYRVMARMPAAGRARSEPGREASQSGARDVTVAAERGPR